MQVLFKSRHPQATDLRDLTERRVRFVLRRLGWLVPRADVQMSDVNGPPWPATGARRSITRWHALRASSCACGAGAVTPAACANASSVTNAELERP